MKKHFWTEAELQIIRSDYPFMQTIKLAERFNVTERAVYSLAFVLGLKKDPVYLNSPESGRLAKGDTRGIKSRFVKGQIPPNKGKKWSDYMTKEAQERIRKTTFKKGNFPATTVHFGKPYLHFRKRKDGYVEKLWFIQEGVNKRSAYLAYLCRINKIDLKGKKPVLKAGFDHSRPPVMEDIEVITNAECMRRNSVQRFPEDLRKLVQIKGVLNRQIKKQYELNNID